MDISGMLGIGGNQSIVGPTYFVFGMNGAVFRLFYSPDSIVSGMNRIGQPSVHFVTCAFRQMSVRVNNNAPLIDRIIQVFLTKGNAIILHYYNLGFMTRLPKAQ